MRPGSLRAGPLPRIALFSDVDGTLLDASNRLAITAGDVARIAAHVELILASSRTLVELGVLQRRLGVVAPLIAENGAVVSFPLRWRGGRAARREIVVLGQPVARLRPRIRKCAREAAVTIVDQRDVLPDRARSLRRGYSVCVRDFPGPGAERFLTALRRENLRATRAGNWITITQGADKGTGARAVLARAQRRGAPFAWNAAIGNAANDVPLFAASEGRFAIRNPRSGHHSALLDLPDVKPLASSGKRAWREALPMILAGGKP
ncbi:MAG TPA: HAD hydrolase family protein [Gemmatimonadaceae bacterium]